MKEVKHPNAVKVLSVLKQYVDEKYTEQGDNITPFGKWYGLQGQPWCAMFISYAFSQSGLSHLVAAQSSKGFASCNIGYQWFVKNKRTVPVGKAEPGDIVFFNFDNNPHTTEHVGIVVSNDGKNLITFEGNTSGDYRGSQANGGGAFKKKRPYATVMGVVRPDWDKPAPKTKKAAPKKKAVAKK